MRKVHPGQLKTADQAVKTKCQHKRPCSNCPWAHKSLPGWLGSNTAAEWIDIAHGEPGGAECHTTDKQCAGMVIYQANVCKSPRDSSVLRLPQNKTTVFASAAEFKAHHSKQFMEK